MAAYPWRHAPAPIARPTIPLLGGSTERGRAFHEGRIMLSAAASGVLSFIALSIACSVWMRQQSADRIAASLEDLPRNARIVVLGCPTRSRNGDPNRYFVARIAAAAAAHHYAISRASPTDAATGRLLCSGWDGHGEATELREALIAAGVSPHRIDVDGNAARTIDSIDHAATHHGEERIVFVSQAFHLPRVLYLARGRGLDAWGLRAEGTIRRLRPRLREALARFRAIADVGLRRRRR